MNIGSRKLLPDAAQKSGIKGLGAGIIPTCSLKLNLKQICLWILAVGILIICIIGEAQAIRFFVAILLPRGMLIMELLDVKIKICDYPFFLNTSSI